MRRATRPTDPRRALHRTAVTVLLASLAVLGACSAGDDAATDSGAGAADMEMDDAERGAAEPDAADGSGPADRSASDGTLQLASASAGRRVITTAELVLEVVEPADAADEIAAIGARAGGFVAETDLERDHLGVVRGSITLRVPSATLFEVVEELDALGAAVPVRRIDERDVTGEMVDLEAQRTNLIDYERQLRSLLADVRETTTRPDDLLTVFERIRSVRHEIDRIDARLAVLDDQVSLSTVHVTLRPSAAALPVTDPTWQPVQTVRDALAATAGALTTVADAAIWISLTALPIALVVSSPLAIAWLAWRGRRRQGGPSPAAPPPPA